MSGDKVRVRFAPSPTGYLHVGGLRTALYNYLFARHNKGKFILRIEDTDRARYVEGAVENLINTLKWSGLEYDEGPDIGGDYGPYFQSERLEFYKKYADELIEKGAAYYCFCTPEELEKMREEQISKKLPPKYDGRCRHLTPEEVQQKLNSGIPHVVRLKMPDDRTIFFNDLIRGEVSFQSNLIDDQILLKSDGYPTYHLANVIDDHFMGITHVIRGEEWLPSTPKHIVLYEALGWKIPEFAHLPLLLNSDRSKLSKRQGDVAVEDYRKHGYLPEALLNFVALLGWNPGNEQEIFSKEELIELFSLDRVNKAGAVFDINKLKWMNAQYMKKLSDDELFNFVLPYLEEKLRVFDDIEKTKKMVLAVKDGLQIAEDIIPATDIFFKDTFDIKAQEALDILKKDISIKVLTALRDKINEIDTIDKDVFIKVMKEVSKQTGAKRADLWMPVRIALTGVTHGPEITAVVEIFGKEKCLSQINSILENLI